MDHLHPELRSLVSQFCALECCPPNIREALSLFLMTGDVQAANDLRKSSTWSCDDLHLYWGDVLDHVVDFQVVHVSGNVALTYYSVERLTFRPLRRMLKTIPKIHAELP